MSKLQTPDVHVSVISDIVFDPYFVPFMKVYFGENVKIYPIHNMGLNYDEYRKQLEISNIIIVWLNIESLYLNACNALSLSSTANLISSEDIITSCEKLYTDISACSSSLILWFTFDNYYMKSHITCGRVFSGQIERLNIQLYDTFKNFDNIIFINLNHLIAEVGLINTYDSKGKYRWNAPYSKILVEVVVKEIHKQYLIENGITKKCLVLDCDNVLWGGILSEDGVENLKLGGSGLGRPYQDFQRFVFSLYSHGVILAICSKNDLSDVMIMFHEHSEMILKEEHIACFQVNWENKPENIRRIAEKLNIDLDSMVFIDDSPVEIEAVKVMLPEVTAIVYERDTVYDKLSCFNLKSNIRIADIKKRNETYLKNQFREALKSQYNSFSDYINALGIKLDIHESTQIEISRISELTQRTNKCTNGIRYTVSEIKEKLTDESIILYSVFVSDCFSDLGLVGVIEVQGNILTLFSLSCRALGLEIEDKLLNFIKQNHRITKIRFKLTGKNDRVRKLLLNTFFKAEISD